MKFSGVVVTYNDARRLADCLNSLKFCSELLVIDLGSSDDSLNIAKLLGAKIVHHEWVPDIDQIRNYASYLAKHDWIVFLDPDEVFPSEIVTKIDRIIENNNSVGLIALPWRFYYKGKPLKYTIWGAQKKSKHIVYHRKRVRFSKLVHHGIGIRDGFEIIKFEQCESNVLKHYWMDSYSQLFEKHWRYIKLEGEAQYKEGERFVFRYWTFSTLKTLKENLIDYKGIWGGWRGIFLSFFYTWYVAMSQLSLLCYQHRVKRKRYA